MIVDATLWRITPGEIWVSEGNLCLVYFFRVVCCFSRLKPRARRLSNWRVWSSILYIPYQDLIICRVPLPDGGSLVIEQTEALVSIDVNGGHVMFGQGNSQAKAILDVNLAAAKQVCSYAEPSFALIYLSKHTKEVMKVVCNFILLQCTKTYSFILYLSLAVLSVNLLWNIYVYIYICFHMWWVYLAIYSSMDCIS